MVHVTRETESSLIEIFTRDTIECAINLCNSGCSSGKGFCFGGGTLLASTRATTRPIHCPYCVTNFSRNLRYVEINTVINFRLCLRNLVTYVLTLRLNWHHQLRVWTSNSKMSIQGMKQMQILNWHEAVKRAGSHQESNPGPLAWAASALTTELWPLASHQPPHNPSMKHHMSNVLIFMYWASRCVIYYLIFILVMQTTVTLYILRQLCLLYRSAIWWGLKFLSNLY